MFQVEFDEENKVWNSCHVPPVFNDKISIGHTLLRSMLLNGPKIAQRSDDTGEQVTFEQLRLRTIRAAQNMQKRGIKPNQVIGIMVENVAHLSPIILSALCLGCPINALHSKAEKIDIIRMFKLTEPSIILCDVNAYDLVVESLRELGIDAKIFTFHGTKGIAEPVESLFKETENEEDFVPAEIDAEKHIAAVMKSSGTTGIFKGVTISHAALISSVSSFNIVNANDIFFCFGAMHWVIGLVFLLIGTINGATRIITTEPFSPERQVHIVDKYKVTCTFVAAFYLAQMLKSGVLSEANLSSLKTFLIAGSKVPLSIRNEINSHLPNARVSNSYGLTELGSFVTAEFQSKYTDKDTVGALLNGYKIKVVDENGNRCGVDVDGEIYIKGRYEFLGYYKNDKLTKQTLDEEGFFITGDIGHIDEDGHLYIVDRKKDIIMYDDRIAPSDIEAVLLESPDIAEACAVGVPRDPVVEIPAVAVRRAVDSTISESDVSKLIIDNLGQCCKLSGGVYFVDSLPKTASGKTLRGVVKKRITELYKLKQKIDNCS